MNRQIYIYIYIEKIFFLHVFWFLVKIGEKTAIITAIFGEVSKVGNGVKYFDLHNILSIKIYFHTNYDENRLRDILTSMIL